MYTLAAFFLKCNKLFILTPQNCIVLLYPCKVWLFNERQFLEKSWGLPECAVWNGITFKRFPHTRSFTQVWAFQRASSCNYSKRFPNWNIAADAERKNMFQIVVVSITRVPSVDDELRINHLGMNKICFAWNMSN